MGAAAGAAALGGILSGVGQKMQAIQQEEAAKATARQIRWESQIESENMTTQQRRIASVNITRTAKSGVRMEGSPLEVLAYNAGMAERNLSLQARTSNLLAQRYRWMAQQANRAGDVAFWTAGLVSAGTAASSTSTGGIGLLGATGGAGSSAGSAAAVGGGI